MRKQYRAYTVEIAVYDENTDSIFPEYVACNGYSCENAIKYFIYKTHGTKIVTEINKVSGQIPQDHYESEA